MSHRTLRKKPKLEIDESSSSQKLPEQNGIKLEIDESSSSQKLPEQNGVKLEIDESYSSLNLPEKNGVEQNGDDDSSNYEESVMKRKMQDFAFLSSLGFTEFQPLLDKPKPKPVGSRLKLKPRVETPGPIRRSSRLQNMPAPKPAELQYEVRPQPEEPEKRERWRRRKTPRWMRKMEKRKQKRAWTWRRIKTPKPVGPLLFKDIFLQEDESLTTSLVEEFKKSHSMKLEKKECSTSWYDNNFQSMKLDASRVAKLVPQRIVSLSIHPSEKLFVAVGDKRGRIGFWDVESEIQDPVYLYEPHSKHVSCLEFNPYNNVQLYSTSYDGTVRCGNMEAAVFDEVYRDEDDLLSSFDFLSPSALLVGQRFSGAVVIDCRTEKWKVELVVEADHRAMKTVSLHPEKNHFITCGNEGIINLWDLRMVKNKKPLTELKLPLSINSAYFSPVTGKHIVATCMDHTLRVYDSSSLNDIKLMTTIKHNNHTGRWLTPFRAVWLPNVEERFVVGSMDYPRRIEVFGVNGKLVHSFADEDLNSVCCINAFHSQRPILVGGNSSGKTYVFMGKD